VRLVVDTNVLVSAFLWEGTPGRLIELAGEKEVRLYASRLLLDELAATLNKKKLAKPIAATGMSAEQMVRNYRRRAVAVGEVQDHIFAVVGEIENSIRT
jgi:putative PIN family toxin of toxin-antitoxin system